MPNELDYLRRANRTCRSLDQRLLCEQDARDAEAAKISVDLDEDYAEALMHSAGIPVRVEVPFAKAIVEARNSFCHFPEENLFCMEALRKTCEEYGLEFQPSHKYQGKLDARLPLALKEFKRLNMGTMPDATVGIGNKTSVFWVMTEPAGFSKLNQPGAVHLFCALNHGLVGGNPWFYLVHSWGRPYDAADRLLSWLSRLRGIFALSAIALSAYLTTERAGDYGDGMLSAILAGVICILLHFNNPRYSPFERPDVWPKKAS